MGSGGLVVLDDTACMVDIARYFLQFTQNQSCGKCTFCRIGTQRMLEILDRQSDLELRPQLVEAAAECFPEAAWQRCTVHFYRNVFSHVPRAKVREVAAMLKAIHAQESRAAALDKAQDVVGKLKAMKLGAAAKLVEEHIEETLTYYAFPSQHWLKIRTNNPMERIIREIRRRTRVVGAFPDGQSAVMLCAARLRHIAGTKWGTRRYLSMEPLFKQTLESATA